MAAMGAQPALAQARGKVLDLTHVLDEKFPTFDGAPGIAYEEAVNFDKNGYQLWKLTIFEHSGTHIDAPLHFSRDGASVAELAPESLICPLCVIDITAKARDDANATTDAERQKNLDVEKARYSALASRVDGVLDFADGSQKPTDIHTEIAVSGNVAKSASDRQTSSKTTLQVMLDGVEGINKEDLTAQILTLQTRMQASYATSMILNNLSLLNYMK